MKASGGSVEVQQQYSFWIRKDSEGTTCRVESQLVCTLALCTVSLTPVSNTT